MLKHYSFILISTTLFFLFALPENKKITEKAAAENIQYTYTFGNGTDREINFYMSADSLHWIQYAVVNGYQSKLSYDYAKMYFKIHTGHSEFVVYKIPGDATYKIYYNPAIKKFDLNYFTPVTINF